MPATFIAEASSNHAQDLPREMSEIQAAIGILRRANARESGAQGISLLPCIRAYPTPPEQANLSAIEAIRAATGESVGWPDHARSPSKIEQP